MRLSMRIMIWIMIGLFFLLMASPGLGSGKQAQKTAIKIKMPVYKPPLRGAPVGRVGGGTRGVGSTMPNLIALVPEHIGLTLKERPSLYWYLSKATEHFVEFTLIDDQAVLPLLEKRIGPSVQAGIHCIRLDDHDIRLSIGKPYKWFVALVPAPNHRSRDIIAGGIIELVETPKAIEVKLSRANKTEHVYIYAESGIWYDSLAAISDLIDAEPNNAALRSKRASLLEQVGLSQVADK